MGTISYGNSLLFVCVPMVSSWDAIMCVEVSSRAGIVASELNDRCDSLNMGCCAKHELKYTAESGPLSNFE